MEEWVQRVTAATMPHLQSIGILAAAGGCALVGFRLLAVALRDWERDVARAILPPLLRRRPPHRRPVPAPSPVIPRSRASESGGEGPAGNETAAWYARGRSAARPAAAAAVAATAPTLTPTKRLTMLHMVQHAIRPAHGQPARAEEEGDGIEGDRVPEGAVTPAPAGAAPSRSRRPHGRGGAPLPRPPHFPGALRLPRLPPMSRPTSWPIAYLLALTAVAAVTGLLHGAHPILILRALAPDAPYLRPYGIAYILPVAVAAACGGWLLGLFTLAASALAAATFLMEPVLSPVIDRPRDRMEMALLLLVGSLVTATAHTLRRNTTLLKETRQVALRQRDFLREVLHVVSEERLILCDAERDLPGGLADPLDGPVFLRSDSPASIRSLRRLARRAGAELDFPPARAYDLETAAGEAAMNSVVHGGGGVGRVYLDRDRGTVQVWVRDEGKGIAFERLHRATLEKGYTTAGTLGHGFPLLIRCADRTYLLTGAGGTTVVVEMDADPAP